MKAIIITDMKKVSIYLAAAAILPLLCASCAKKSTVSGQLEGLGDSLKVEVFDISNGRTPLSSMIVPVVDGKFTCDVSDTTVRGLLLSDPSGNGGKASLIYVPGEYAQVTGRLDSLVVTGGSPFYKDQKAYDDLIENDRIFRIDGVNGSISYIQGNNGLTLTFTF